jgi:hypothetical protein
MLIRCGADCADVLISIRGEAPTVWGGERRIPSAERNAAPIFAQRYPGACDSTLAELYVNTILIPRPGRDVLDKTMISKNGRRFCDEVKSNKH